MAKTKSEKNNRKTTQEVLEMTEEPVIVDNHVNDWHFLGSGKEEALQTIRKRLFELGYTSTFNFHASSKSIRYRQLDADGELVTSAGVMPNKRGDYLLMDQQVGKTIVPYKLFTLLL